MVVVVWAKAERFEVAVQVAGAVVVGEHEGVGREVSAVPAEQVAVGEEDLVYDGPYLLA